MSLHLSIGERLGDLISQRGINIQKLSEDTGVPKATISEIINNKDKNFGYRTMIKIAQYLNVSSDYLFGLSDVPTNDKDLKFVCEYTGLSEKAAKVLHATKSNLELCKSVEKMPNDKIQKPVFSTNTSSKLINESGEYKYKFFSEEELKEIEEDFSSEEKKNFFARYDDIKQFKNYDIEALFNECETTLSFISSIIESDEVINAAYNFEEAYTNNIIDTINTRYYEYIKNDISNNKEELKLFQEMKKAGYSARDDDEDILNFDTFGNENKRNYEIGLFMLGCNLRRLVEKKVNENYINEIKIHYIK